MARSLNCPSQLGSSVAQFFFSTRHFIMLVTFLFSLLHFIMFVTCRERITGFRVQDVYNAFSD